MWQSIPADHPAALADRWILPIEPPHVEGDGWLDWSGLATLLANLGNEFLQPANRLMLSLPYWQ
jgi:hypothetical protein